MIPTHALVPHMSSGFFSPSEFSDRCITWSQTIPAFLIAPRKQKIKLVFFHQRGPTRRGESSTPQAGDTERENKTNGEIALSGNIPTKLTSSHRATTPMKYHWSSGKRRIQDLPTEKSQCPKEHSYPRNRSASYQIPASCCLCFTMEVFTVLFCWARTFVSWNPVHRPHAPLHTPVLIL